MNNSPTLILKSASVTTEQHNVRSNYVDGKTGYLVLKRIFDIVFSIFFLVFIGTWLFPLVALLVWIDSKGPVIFVQKRIGKGGKTFHCIKFRTMVLNTEANNKQAEADDIRITRIGRFLRNSSLDEIPQFLNVIAGHMSVVGPRPHMHSDCERFEKLIPEYEFRHFVKPGITGLAQVKGFRGPAIEFESIFHRYQYDAFYVRNCTFWLDIRIVRKTAVQTIIFLYSKISRKEVNMLAIQGKEDWLQVNVNAS